jgi:hypothetical protein
MCEWGQSLIPGRTGCNGIIRRITWRRPPSCFRTVFVTRPRVICEESPRLSLALKSGRPHSVPLAQQSLRIYGAAFAAGDLRKLPVRRRTTRLTTLPVNPPPRVELLRFIDHECSATRPQPCVSPRSAAMNSGANRLCRSLRKIRPFGADRAPEAALISLVVCFAFPFRIE